jgi:hypothetical protein
MSIRKEYDDSLNPDFIRPAPPEDPAARKARLHAWHIARGTLGIYYDLYPEDRPAEPKPLSHGRGR